jgi:cell wall-associated NlpC family hydrolase
MPPWSSHRADGVTVRRPVVAVRRLAALTAVSAIVAGVLAAPDAFAASSTTAAVANAQQQLDALSVQADKAVEAYDEAQISLSAVTATASSAKAAAAQEQETVDAAKVGVQAFAVARYEGTTATPALAVLLSSDPKTFLERSQLLEQVSSYQSASLTQVINANRVLAVLETSAEQAVTAQQAATVKLTAKKAAVDKVVGQQQLLVNVLQTKAAQDQAATTAAENAAIERRPVVVSRSLSRPGLTTSLRASRAEGPAPVVADLTSAIAPAASGRVGGALAWAYAQLGKPYHYGGAGPRSFDCSGLTMRAFAAAGVSLPHSAAAQQHAGRRVPLSQLQPGDLVFWGSPAYHVGIYVGSGRIIDAPHTGTDVQIQALWGRPSSAVRL